MQADGIKATPHPTKGTDDMDNTIGTAGHVATIIYDGTDAWKDDVPQGWTRDLWIDFNEGRVSLREIKRRGLDLTTTSK